MYGLKAAISANKILIKCRCKIHFLKTSPLFQVYREFKTPIVIFVIKP